MVRSLLFALTSLLIAAPALAADADEFAFAVQVPELKVNELSAITIKIDVKGGYHWNDEYPARFELKGTPEAVTVTKAALSQAAGDFKSETPTAVNVKVPALAKAAANGTVTVEAKFSICNERVCLMKKASAVVAVVAK